MRKISQGFRNNNFIIFFRQLQRFLIAIIKNISNYSNDKKLLKKAWGDEFIFSSEPLLSESLKLPTR